MNIRLLSTPPCAIFTIHSSKKKRDPLAHLLRITYGAILSVCFFINVAAPLHADTYEIASNTGTAFGHEHPSAFTLSHLTTLYNSINSYGNSSSRSLGVWHVSGNTYDVTVYNKTKSVFEIYRVNANNAKEAFDQFFTITSDSTYSVKDYINSATHTYIYNQSNIHMLAPGLTTIPITMRPDIEDAATETYYMLAIDSSAFDDLCKVVDYGSGSFGIGNSNSVTGSLSYLIGNGNTLDANHSVLIGNESSISNRTSAGFGNAILIGGTSNISKQGGIVLGHFSSLTAENAVILGHHSYATGSGSAVIGLAGGAYKNLSVALGALSVADEAQTVSLGHQPGDVWYFSHEQRTYTDTLTRRLINVSNGTSASDAATVGQIVTVTAGDYVTLTSSTNSNGSTNQKIAVTANGSVASGNTGLIKGGVLYSETRPAANGTYIRTTNTTAANLTALDNQLQSVTATADAGWNIQANNSTAQKVASGATAKFVNGSNIEISQSGTTLTIKTADAPTFTGKVTAKGFDASSTKITNVADGALTSGSKDAVNGGQFYTQTHVSNGSVIKAANTVAQNLTALDSSIGTTNNGNIVKAANTIGKNLNALDNAIGTTENGAYVSSSNSVGENLNALDDQVKANTDAIGTTNNGNYVSSSNTIGQNLNAIDNTIGKLQNGTYISASKTIAQNLSGLDDQVAQNTDDIADLQENKADKDLSNLTEDGKSVIRKLAGDGVKVVAGDNAYVETSKAGDVTTYTVGVKDEAILDVLKNADNVEFTNLTVTGDSNLTNLIVDGTSTFNGTSVFNEDVLMKKDLTVEGNSEFNTIVVNNQADFKGPSHFYENVQMDKDLKVDGDTTLNNLTVTNDTHLNTLTVDGTSVFNEDVLMKKDLTVEGNSEFNTITVNNQADFKGPSHFYENVQMDKDLNVDGDTNIGGSLTVSKDLHVAGDSIFDGTSTFNEDVRMNKDLTVEGNSEFNTIVVNNQADFKGPSHFYENVQMDKDLKVDGDTTLNNLTVLNDTHLNTLAVDGKSVFNEDVTMKKNLTVEGNTDLNTLVVNNQADFKGQAHFYENVQMDKDLTVDGDTSIGGNATISKDLHVVGNSTFDGTSTFNSDVTIKKDLTVEGNTDLNTLVVNNQADFKGNAHFYEDVQMDKNLNVDGNTTVGGNMTVNKDLLINGNSTFEGTSHFKDAVTMDKTLDVAGAATFGDNVTVNKDLLINGNSTFEGTSHFKDAVTMDKTLDVKGQATFGDNVSIQKNLSVAGTSHFKDDVQMDKALNVDGPVTFNNTLTVSGLTTFKDSVKMEKDLSVAGDTFMSGNADIGKDLHVKGNAQIDKNLTVSGLVKFEQGADMGGGKITNVGDGRIAPGSKDAINGGQLYEATQNLRSSMADMDARTQQDIRNVGSRAAALAALHPLQYDKQRRTGFNIGYGNYRGDSSVALGLTHHFSKSAMLSASTTVGDNPMMNVGLAFRLGKADPEAERKSIIATAQNAKIARVEAKYAQLKSEKELSDRNIAALISRMDQMEAEAAARNAELQALKAQLGKRQSAQRKAKRR